MSEPGKAVFLSYASQDAEAAKRIADALRQSGVEVWFDAEGGLEHGDEWDAKIRRQIKECVLFLPIISANTQAREEGYFRIEWELAAQRALGIASGVAFILPVVIDDTREPAALVPDRFRTVQWTKLPGGTVPADVLARFLKLWSHRAGALKHAVEEVRGQKSEDRGQIMQQGKPPWPRYALLGLAMLLVMPLLYLALKPRRSPEEIAPPVAPAQTIAADATKAAETKTVAAPASAWPHDPELKRAIDLIDGLESTLEDYRLADEISARAVEKAPSDPETVTVRARVESAFVTRNFDFSNERAAAAKRFGERAVQLSPDDPQALYALSIFLHDRAGDEVRAEALARRASELAPDNPRFARQLFRVIVFQHPEQAVTLGEDLIRRFPADVLAHYELSIAYRDARNWEKFERENDATIALFPLANALNWKARAAGLLHGDFAGMREWIDRVPARVRAEERTVISAVIYATLGGDYDYGLKSLQAFAEPWFYDVANYAGPAALPQATLLAQQGKAGLAREQYEQSLKMIAQHKQDNPSDQTARRAEIWTLLGLGRLEEARALYRTELERFRRPYRIFAMSGWWFEVIPLGLLLGEHDTALQLIREAAANAEGRHTIRDRLASDARMAPFRADPEITALLAEPAAFQITDDDRQGPVVAVPPVDAKSIAVLAFANLSDDKDNEYFSDGISEELLNVLAKVKQLKVAARTSSFSFKGQNVPVPDIASKLGVAYVVEGSVRKAGNKVRITAQLIKAADGFHVWSETFDRELKDIFAVQDEIAKNVLEAVKGSLIGGEQAPQTATTKIEAYTFYLQGQTELAKRGEVGLREAIRLFDAALAIDPDYIPALVGLARAAVVLPSYASLSGAEGRETVDRAKAAAARVLELDPRNAAAYTVLGWAHAQADWHWSEGEAELLKAKELAPNDPWVANFIGDYYRFVGDNRASIAAKQLAWQLDPLSRVSHWDLGFAYVAAGDYDQAIRWGESAIALAPHNFDSYQPVILAAMHRGQLDLMRRTLGAARQNTHEDEGFLLLYEVVCAIAEKDTAAARRFLGQAEAKAQAGQASSAYVGYCHLLLGDSAEALRWLQLGYDRRDQALIWTENIDYDVIAANPVTRPILDLPGLKELYELRQRNARANRK